MFGTDQINLILVHAIAIIRNLQLENRRKRKGEDGKSGWMDYFLFAWPDKYFASATI